MATKNDDQPGGKRRQHSQKSDRRTAKGNRPQSAASVSRQPDQRDQATPMVASSEVPTTGPVEPAEVLANGGAEPAEVLANGAAEPAEITVNGVARLTEIPLIGEVIPPDAPSAGAARPTEGFPVTVAAIAMAYGEYARRSFQENKSFVERFMRVRSFEQAVEIQTEFARAAYANFVAESQKICELYGELARQVFRPFGITQFRRQVN